MTGKTASINFPTTSGVFDSTHNGDFDVFVTKLNATGSALVYSTYLGGTGLDEAGGIAVDASGSAYVTGDTTSADFPTTLGAFDTTYGKTPGAFDAFVTKLNPAGSAPLEYSTYLGGSGSCHDSASDIAVDASGSAYVTGQVSCPNFPTTPGAFDTTHNGGFDAFVTKFNPTGSALVYSTYLGGSSTTEQFDPTDFGLGIAVDDSGSAYVTGMTVTLDFPTTPGAFDQSFNSLNSIYFDVFMTKFNAAGSALDYSTYLGGFGDDRGFGIAVDDSGNAYVTGTTASEDFPSTPGAFDLSLDSQNYDAFVTKLNAAGSAPLVYSTYLGGSAIESGFGIAVDASGSAYVTGQTASTNFPTTPGTFDSTFNGGVADAFVTKLNATGSAPLVYSTYLGGSDNDSGGHIALDASDSAYVIGSTASADFPTTPATFDSTHNGDLDVFVAKITENRSPTASGGGPYTVGEGGSVTLSGSGSDLDGDPLSYAWDLDNNGSFETPGQNPSFSAAGRDGPSSQTVVLRVCDDKNACGTSSATVNITNVPPTANPDAASTNEDTAVVVNVIANDTDVPGDPLTVTSVSSPTANGGTATNNGNGTVTYAPPLNFAGGDSFSYNISDGDGGVAGASVNITVNPVNDPPVNTVPGAQGTARNVPLLFSTGGGNPISIADIDASAARVTLSGNNGTLTLSRTTGLTFTAGDGTGDPLMTFTGTIADINAALNGMRFTPANGFSGAASVTITTNDQGQTGAGGALSDTDTVPITVGSAASADLAITMTDAPDPVPVNTNLTYTIGVRNNGPFSATTVTLFDNLPGSVIFVSATPSQGTCTGTSLVRCDLGTLSNGGTATVTIVVRPTQRRTITNQAGVGANQSDPNTANNTAVVQTRVN